MRLHPLTFLDEGDEVVIGRTDTDSYGVFPPDAAELLRRLGQGTPPDAAAAWYARTYGEQVDIEDFIASLDDLGFVAPEQPDEPIAPDRPHPPGAPQTVRWQRLGRLAFSPAAWVCYALVIAVATASIVDNPRLVPHTANLFFTRYPTVIGLTLFLGQLPLLLLHESFHALAGRRLGLRSRLRLSHRLYFVVFETSLDGLVVRPRRERYLPMFAGMLADILVVATLTLAAAATARPDGTVPLVGGLCLALAFATAVRFAWQFFFHLRTDVYHVAIVALGCHDLHAASWRILRNRLRRIRRRPPADTSDLSPRDLAVGRWYSWLLLVGYAFSLSTFALVAIPALVRSVELAVGRLTRAGLTAPGLLDSVTFLVLTGGQFLLAGYLAIRRRRRPTARAATARHEMG